MVVRMRHTKSHTKNRRSHHALKPGMFVACTNCKALKRSHSVCMSCGYYRGKSILNLAAIAERKAKKDKARKAEAAKQ